MNIRIRLFPTNNPPNASFKSESGTEKKKKNKILKIFQAGEKES